MNYDSDKNFFICVVCKGEFWPQEDNNFKNIEQLWRDEQHYKKTMSKPGGGSRAGKNREEKRKIKPVYQTYE